MPGRVHTRPTGADSERGRDRSPVDAQAKDVQEVSIRRTHLRVTCTVCDQSDATKSHSLCTVYRDPCTVVRGPCTQRGSEYKYCSTYGGRGMHAFNRLF